LLETKRDNVVEGFKNIRVLLNISISTFLYSQRGLKPRPLKGREVHVVEGLKNMKVLLKQKTCKN
jgi:hypothetical protein